MRKFGILSVYVILVLTSCTKSTVNHNYHDTQYGFYADFPSDWSVKKNYEGNYLTIISPIESKNDLWRENVTFNIQKINKTTDIFKDLSQMYNQFGDTLIEQTRYKLNGIERELFSYKAQVNGIQVVSHNTLFRIDNAVFSISGMAEVSKTDFQELFKNIVDSIGKE